jgi:hypothetical protein
MKGVFKFYLANSDTLLCFSICFQIAYTNLHTPFAGRPLASQRAGAVKKIDMRTQFLELSDLEET